MASQTPQTETTTPPPKLLDTNVIIDGRIYDICRSGFIEARSSCPDLCWRNCSTSRIPPMRLRRNRGRRGLDILQQMQTELDNCRAHHRPL